MKLVFLDIDGVLNSHRSALAFGEFPWPNDEGAVDPELKSFDLVALKLIQKAIRDNQAQVVLSSSWRLDSTKETVGRNFAPLGLPIIDRTPSLSGQGRGAEIQAWLDANQPTLENYVIVDDDADMLDYQLERFIHVNGEDGFSFKNYLQLDRMLK